VLGIVLLGQRPIHLHELERGDPQALGLESREDLTDQPALNTIGLEYDQGTLHAN
jgi:hypothetical protein